MLSQKLPVSARIEKYFREKTLRILRVPSVLISRLCTAAGAILVVFRVQYTVLYSACGILLYLQYFGDVYCGYCQMLAVFRPVRTASAGTASTASTRSKTKILSICAVYWGYEVYFDHLFVNRRFDNFIRFLLKTSFTVHGWSHGWELKQITFGGGTRGLRALAIFLEYMRRALEIYTDSALLIP